MRPIVIFNKICVLFVFSLYSIINLFRIDWNLVWASTPITSAYSAVMMVWLAVTGDILALLLFSLKCLKARFSMYCIKLSSTGWTESWKQNWSVKYYNSCCISLCFHIINSFMNINFHKRKNYCFSLVEFLRWLLLLKGLFVAPSKNVSDRGVFRTLSII